MDGFLKMGHFRPLFLYFRLFYCTIGRLNFADVWIQTWDLWSWKHPPYQLSHNHCPFAVDVFLKIEVFLMGLHQFAGGTNGPRHSLLHFDTYENILMG